MKYPLDKNILKETLQSIESHSQSQEEIINKLSQILTEAVKSTNDKDASWIIASKEFFKNKKESENNIESFIVHKDSFAQDSLENEAEAWKEDELDRYFNKKESKTLRDMTEEEIDCTPIPKLEKLVKEAEEEEEKSNNSTDIYKIKARVANLARGPGMHLTPTGEILCNVFVHMLKELYDFTDTLKDEKIKESLYTIIRKQENVPNTIIAAAGQGRS